jgi:hypothetical protein
LGGGGMITCARQPKGDGKVEVNEVERVRARQHGMNEIEIFSLSLLACFLLVKVFCLLMNIVFSLSDACDEEEFLRDFLVLLFLARRVNEIFEQVFDFLVLLSFSFYSATDLFFVWQWQ